MDFDLTPEQGELQERALEAGREFRDECARWDAEDQAPYREVSDRMGELGFFGLTMPEEFGGQGLTALDYLIATAAIFRASQTWLCCEPLFCTSGPGPSMILLGDEPVRRKYLPDIVRGQKGCNIALTEPDHGSALTHLETAATLDGEECVVNGSKSYVTGAQVNELNAVFVRFDGIPGAKGIGAMIVEEGTEGVRVERGPTFVGDGGVPHGDLKLEDARVPAENLIVGPGQFARLKTAFNMERLHKTAFWLGAAEAAYDEAAATATDGRFPDPMQVTVAKLFGATMGPRVTLQSLELHGGYGVTMDYPIQRIHRDAISNVVAGGAPAVLRNGIAAGLFPHRKFPQTRGSQVGP